MLDPPPPAPRFLPEPAPAQTSRWVRVVVVTVGLIGALVLVAWGWGVARTTAEDPQTSTGEPSVSPSPRATANSPSPEMTYSRYDNERFGFAVDVPIDWVADPESGSGDGIVHRSPDGLGSLTVFGANNLDGDSVETASDTAQQAINDDEGDITYADDVRRLLHNQRLQRGRRHLLHA